MKKDKLIPKRRFKEFKNDEAWEQRKVKDIFKVTRGYVLAATKTAPEKTDSMSYPVYSSQTKDQGLMGYYSDFLYENAITWTTDGANAGTVSYREGKFYCTNVCGVLISEDGYANKMVSEALNKIAWKHVSKVGNPKLMNNVMSDIIIFLPKIIEEQVVISRFLNKIDNLITLHQRKLKKLKELKLAYLSEMFPEEGEKYPKRRFYGFTDPWEQREFKDTFVKLQNNSLSRAQLNYEQGIAYNVHYGDILIIFGECLDVRKEQIPYINNDDSVDKYKTSFLKNGDIIFADAAEDETVGKCTEIQGLTTEIVISGLHTIPCRPIQSFADGYLGYYLNSNAYHNQLLPLMQGTKVSSISRSSLDETYVVYPKSKEEQMQIGTFFKKLDNLITLHHRKLEKLENMKKAYLNEMFV